MAHVNRWVRTLLLTLLVGAALLTLPVWGQVGGSYDLTWWTVDNGGSIGSPATGYTIRSTSGQPDAQTLSGGAYTLRGGFWTTGNASTNRVYLPHIQR